jgi:hypothetical protein
MTVATGVRPHTFASYSTRIDARKIITVGALYARLHPPLQNTLDNSSRCLLPVDRLRLLYTKTHIQHSQHVSTLARYFWYDPAGPALHNSTEDWTHIRCSMHGSTNSPFNTETRFRLHFNGLQPSKETT